MNVGGKRTKSEEKERGTSEPKKVTGNPSISHRLLSCCKSTCQHPFPVPVRVPLPVHKVVLYAILQSILLLPKSAAKPVSTQAASDCHSDCKILHSNSPVPSNRPYGNYGNSLDTYKHCVLACCVKEEIDNLIHMRNDGTNNMADFLGNKRETYDENLKENKNVLFTRVPSFLTTLKRETPAKTTQNGYNSFYRIPIRSRSGFTKREAPDTIQNENRLFPFARSGKCAKFVSVQYEHQVDKMSVVIPDAASPQKRRWGSAIGPCINAHCSDLSGTNRAECIMAKCHRSRRSNDIDATEDDENILINI